MKKGGSDSKPYIQLAHLYYFATTSTVNQNQCFMWFYFGLFFFMRPLQKLRLKKMHYKCNREEVCMYCLYGLMVQKTHNSILFQLASLFSFGSLSAKPYREKNIESSKKRMIGSYNFTMYIIWLSNLSFQWIAISFNSWNNIIQVSWI